jgi:ABC-2 type transport system permease protein
MRCVVKAFWMMTQTDLKLFGRSPVELFFTFAFPLLNILLFGSMYGNEPSPYFGGRGSADVMIPGYIAALVIGTTAFMNLPLEMAARRQFGVLRRFRASPVHPLVVVGSQVVLGLIMAAFSSILMILVGHFVFGAALPANPLTFSLGFLFACLSLYALTLLLSNLVRTAAAARAVFMALFFPMMFISGGTLPLQFLPAAVGKIAQWLPLTYTVNLIRDLYFNAGWNLAAVGVLSVMLVVCSVLGVRFFRWE